MLSALLPAAGEPAVGAPDGASDPSRDLVLRADPRATVAFYPLPDGTSGQCLGRSWSGSKRVPKTKRQVPTRDLAAGEQPQQLLHRGGRPAFPADVVPHSTRRYADKARGLDLRYAELVEDVADVDLRHAVPL